MTVTNDAPVLPSSVILILPSMAELGTKPLENGSKDLRAESPLPEVPAVEDKSADDVVVFSKFKAGKKNVKKRVHDGSLTEEGDSVVITKKVKTSAVGLVDEAAAADGGVSILEGTGYGFSYESSGAKRTGSSDQGATMSNKDLEDAQDKNQPAPLPKESVSADGRQLYVGQAGYAQHVKQSKYSGPVRQTAHIRPDVRMDFARDICKDYKETGYCGWGDTCIFLHDRGDYKAGWQIDREWEIEQKQKREARAATFAKTSGSTKASQDNVTEDGLKVSAKGTTDLPFACYLCRKPFVDPVVTKCGHYFCQKCALDRYATDKTCAVCKEPTGGSFNSGVKILRRRDELAKLAAADREPK